MISKQKQLFNKSVFSRPFLKWAGGKTQLIPEIKKLLPPQLFTDTFTYIEPFLGSGAVLFWMLNNFPNLEKVIINDVNSDLINAYKIISSNPNELISILNELQHQFHSLQEDENRKKEYYYQKRDLYNTRSTDEVTQASLFIFLNRTCFNGLYRVNKNNFFNVPMGSYKLPTICDAENILAVSNALQKVKILNGDYEDTLNYVDENSFFYFDPPYKPLSLTSSFTAYGKDEFNDSEQIRLRDFCQKLHNLGYKWILSNSDSNDSFFDLIYNDFQIKRVKAKRSINSKASGRGELNEILIKNYVVKNVISFNFQTQKV